MRRPALYRPTPADTHTWAHPYTGPAALAVFYNDGGQPPAPAPVPTPADVAGRIQPPAAPAAGVDPEDEKVSFTQRRLNKMMSEEKDEGRRSAYRSLAEAVGLDPETFDPTAFAEMFKQADKARRDQLSEEQRRAEELARREQELDARVAAAEQREAEAAARDRESRIRSALVTLGATGDDLDDAFDLIRGRIPENADDTAISEAAEALKARRGELFGATPQAAPTVLPPAPSGAPAGGPPSRTPAGTKDAIKSAARARAEAMGLRNDDAA